MKYGCLYKTKKIDILAINETKIDHRIEDRLISLEDFSRCRYAGVGKEVVLLSMSEMQSGLNPGKIFQINRLN